MVQADFHINVKLNTINKHNLAQLAIWNSIVVKWACCSIIAMGIRVLDSLALSKRHWASFCINFSVWNCAWTPTWLTLKIQQHHCPCRSRSTRDLVGLASAPPHAPWDSSVTMFSFSQVFERNINCPFMKNPF